MKKDTIYIDSDDEIIAITDKVIGSDSDIVALVLPKRCPTLQSAINLKILNKTAKAADKNVVLITSEPSILQIAGLTGMYTAPTLQSKPEIPDVDESLKSNEIEELEDVSLASESTKEDEKSQPEQPSEEEKQVPAKDKKKKVPNFDTFRKKLFLGIGILIGLGLIIYLLFFFLPKANIVITTNTQNIELTSDLTALSTNTTNNIDTKSFILQTKNLEKTDSKKVPTTGERNDGTKATGTITIYNCDYSDGFTLPAGTVFSTAFGSGVATFVSDSPVSVPKFTGSASNCSVVSPFTNAGKASVSVTASRAGSEYNLSGGRNYSISSIPSSAKVSAIGANMGGGQDKKVKIVAEADCTSAKDQLLGSINSEENKTELLKNFQNDGVVASLDTFSSKTLSIACSPAVGSEASEVTATAKNQYTMSGVDSKALGELLDKEAKAKAGNERSVTNNGLSTAVLSVKQKKSDTSYVFEVKTQATVGLKQDSEAIAQQIRGKNARETADIIKALPGVEDVKIDYSPFWVTKTPNNTKKINIEYANTSN